MGTKSGIGYVNHSLNFWMGCTKLRPELGCKNCYAEREMKRFGKDPAKVVRTRPATWRQPLLKRGRRGRHKWKPGSYVFVCPRSDFFHPVADQWQEDAWRTIHKRPDLIWVIVTKRVDRVLDCMPVYWHYKNIILVATVENQQGADDTIPELLAVKAVCRTLRVGVSLEPLLGPVDLTHIKWAKLDTDSWPKEIRGAQAYSTCNVLRRPPQPEGKVIVPSLDTRLDWVLIGGESGPGARPMHPDWVRSIRDQCKAADVPFFFKQWGRYYPWRGANAISPIRISYRPMDADVAIFPDGRIVYRNELQKMSTGDLAELTRGGAACFSRVGKKKAGNLLYGKKHEDYPQ